MSSLNTVAASLHPLEVKVLAALAASSGPVTDDRLADAAGLEPSQVSMAVGWLLTKALIAVEQETIATVVSLTDVGRSYGGGRTPIERILRALRDAETSSGRLTMKELQAQEDLAPTDLSSAIGALKKEGVVRVGPGGVLELTGKSSSTADALRSVIGELGAGPRALTSFTAPVQDTIRGHAVRRGNTQEPFRIDERPTRHYVLTADGGAMTALLRDLPTEEVSQLTPELLKDGSWRTKQFRKYSIGLRPPRLVVGRRHPYRAFLDSVKAKLVGLGFQEMRGPLVETEFWNMDALYMPQFHPARAIHDVYFVKKPTHASGGQEPYLSRVAEVHERGGSTGSIGWSYTYDRVRAQRLVLRSQGTAVSSRTLASQPAIPGKYFSIARCFRYDAVDATHATDFFQVEGIVLGPDITFRTLLGLLDLFAREVAQAKESKFLPAYFPFTEPSVELHARHPKLGWMELGGAGLFRPEVTLPLGVSVPVIAWGLGLDRMAMVALGIHDIRDLFTGDLELLRTMKGTF